MQNRDSSTCTSKVLTRLCLKLLQSRYTDRWSRRLSLEDKRNLLLRFWVGLNKGLSYRERYLLLREAYEDRRMKNYPLLDSAAQAKIYGYFSLVDEIRSVEGDVVEAGVGRGFSLAALAYAVSYFKLDKVIYGFDSFTGFPPATENDLGSRVSEAGKVPEGWSDTSPELVASIFEYDRSKISSLLREHDVQLEIVPGFFEDTLPDLLPSQIAFLHVDSDLYDSIKVVLERCLPRLSSGGIVIVDEYHDERWPGAKKATDEIFKRLGLNIEYFDVIRRYGVRVP